MDKLFRLHIHILSRVQTQMTKGVTKHALCPVRVLKLLDPNTNTHTHDSST